MMDKYGPTLKPGTTWPNQDAPPLGRSLSGSDTIVQAESNVSSSTSTKSDKASVAKESTLRHHDKPDLTLLERRNDTRMPLKESLGFGGVAVIVGGTIAILGGFAFLTFLWFGHGSQAEASDATWVWRQLALWGYMNQAITLASLVLTAAVGFQATVCTSSMSPPPLPAASLLWTRPCD